MTLPTKAWDAAEYLRQEEDVVAYLNVALEDGDPRLLQAALGDVARARGMTAVSKRSGLGRESLYKALKADATPSFATVMKVANAVGARLVFQPAVSSTAI